MFKKILASAFNLVGAPIQLRYANIRIRDGQVVNGTVNPTALANPATTPTIAVTGGGASGGNLQAGTYFAKYTDITALGETLASPESLTFTVVAGNIPRITMPAVPGTVVSRKIYLTPTNGLSNSETLYATQTTAATTFDMQNPFVVGGVAPPVTNSTGSYAVGTTTMTVSFTTALVTGNQFTIGTEHQIYRITAHTETSGSTTSITFTPPTDLKINSGEQVSVSGHVLNIKVGEGSMTHSEKRNIIYVKDRGVLDTVRLGEDTPIDVKFEFTWEFLTAVGGSGVPTIEDALKQTGEAANWVSSSADPCEPYAVDIEVEYVPPCASVQREVMVFSDFRWEDLAHDIKQAQISVTGKCNIIAVISSRVP